MKLKKIIMTMVIGVMTLATLTSCVGEKETTTKEPTDYPYSDFLDYKVYASDVESWDNWEETVAEDTIENVVTGNATFNGVVYSQLTFIVKPGTNIKSVSFDLETNKDCVVRPFVRTYSPAWSEEVGEETTLVCYIDDDKEKKSALSVGEDFPVTIETIRDVTYDAGLYPEGMDSKYQYISILYKIYRGPSLIYDFWYNRKQAKEEGFDVKIKNVSFEIEKLVD